MMKKHSFSLLFLATAMISGCYLEAPCKIDELYNDEGICVKCYQYIDPSGNAYHLNDEGRCEMDTVNACGEGKIDCQTMDNASETHCDLGNCVIDTCIEEYTLVNGKCEYKDDADFDGVENAFDPCPYNPTKWQETWWNKDKTEGIRCTVRDTDGDGYDDEEDKCETNPNKHDGCDQPETKDECCGLTETVEEEGQTYTYYHVYNAMDLYHLSKANKLIPQERYDDYQSRNGTCIDNNYWSCPEDGMCTIMACGSCETDEEDELVCNGYSYINQFSIVLEDDINLDDIYDEQAGVNTEFHNKSCSLSNWTALNTITGAFFDGMNHKIYYQRNLHNDQEESIRCSLSDALFNTINSSQIYDLTIDLDMIGSGRALFTNSADSADFNNIHISGTVDHTDTLPNIGSLVGYLNNQYGFHTYFDNIYIQNLTVNAPFSDYVGGLLGTRLDTLNVYALSDELITLESVSVSGKGGVGGVIGEGFFRFNELKTNIESVTGKNYVGGFCGACFNYYSDKVESWINQVKEVSGEECVGGFAGYYDGMFTMNLAVNRVEKINGKETVGGFIGWALDIVSSDDPEITIYNFIKSITASGRKIGGFIGETSLDYYDSAKINNIYNHVVQLRNTHYYTGGFISNIFDSCQIANVINKVDSISTYSASGGFVGYFENNLIVNNIVNIVENLKATCVGNNCSPISGFLNDSDPDDNHFSAQINNVFSQVNSIKSQADSCGFMCEANDSTFSNIHSQVNDIDGKTVSGFISNATSDAQIQDVSSFAVLNSCDDNNNGFLSTNINDDSSSSAFTLSNAVSAVFSKANSETDYRCDAVISKQAIPSLSDVYYYAPNEHFLPGGPNDTNENIHSFTDSDISRIAKDAMGNESNVLEFNYGSKTVSLPAAITMNNFELTFGQLNQEIINQYDFSGGD